MATAIRGSPQTGGFTAREISAGISPSHYFSTDGGGHLWLRVDGQQRGEMLQFDNRHNRAPKGTTDWQEYSIVLDVPEAASTLNHGFFLQGSGHVWVNALTITPVGTDVPTIDMNSVQTLPNAPVNLGFDPHSSLKG